MRWARAVQYFNISNSEILKLLPSHILPSLNTGYIVTKYHNCTQSDTFQRLESTDPEKQFKSK